MIGQKNSNGFSSQLLLYTYKLYTVLNILYIPIRFELKPIFYTYEITQKLVLLRISFQNGGYHSEFTKTRKYFFITSKYFALDTSVPVDAVLYELWCKLGTFWRTTTNNVRKLWIFISIFYIWL